MTPGQEAWEAAVRITLLFRPISLSEHKDVGLVLSENYRLERDRREVVTSSIELTSRELFYRSEEERIARDKKETP